VSLLITGYSGFVGSNFVIGKNEEIQFLGRKKPLISSEKQVWLKSVNPRSWNERLPNDCSEVQLLHLAWVARGKYLDSNDNELWLDASKTLYDSFLQRGGRRFITLGTSFETNFESTAIQNSSYVKSKLSFRDFVLKSEQAVTTWIRPNTLFGRFEDSRRLVPTIINSLLEGKRATIHTPSELRDFTPVEILVNYIEECFEKETVGAVNCGTGKMINVNSINSLIRDTYFGNDIDTGLQYLSPYIKSSIDYWRNLRGDLNLQG
jgi:nucleoside-diphosphate-sugar epimerase